MAILAPVGCKKNQQDGGGAPPPPTVTVAKPERREIIDWDEYTGRLQAQETVEIRPRVSGWLDEVHFQEGKSVKKGDLLYSIDPRPYQASFDKASADYERAQNRESQAKNELDRVKGLVASKAVSEEIYDTREKAYADAKSEARAAKAALDMAQLDLDFTKVRAPIDGKISRTLVTKGNLVSGGANAGVSTLLTSIVSTSPIYLYVDVDEAASLKYRRLFAEGKRESAIYTRIPCWMALGDEEGWPHEGYVDFVDTTVDPGTGTILCRGVFEVKNRELAPGFFARARVPGSEKYPALLVPETCIGSDQAMKFVYVVDDQGLAQRRTVKLGAMVDGGLRVVKDGLKGDENVVINGQSRIMGVGVPVTPQTAPAEPPKTAAQ